MKQEMIDIDDISLSSIQYDKEKSSPTFKFNSETENTAINNIEKKDKLKNKIRETERRLERLERGIQALKGVEHSIISLRYIEGLGWREIAYKVNYSQRHCTRTKNNAIRKLSVALFGDNEK